MDAQYSVLALDAMGQFSHPAQRPSPLAGALIVVALPVVGVASSDVLLTRMVASPVSGPATGADLAAEPTMVVDELGRVVTLGVLLTLLLVAGCSLAVGVAGKPPGSTPNMRG